MLQRILLIISLTVVFSFAKAQEYTREIKEVVVEADALHKAIEEQKEAKTSKIVISKKDLNNFGHHTAGDILKRMPRIFVQGPPTFNRNIMMAGLDKQYQCVLIDGQRPAGGEDYRDLKLDRIPVDMIEEIEIIYNPPAELGADASIGVINIKLKEAPEQRIMSLNVAGAHTSTHSGVNPELNATFGNTYGKFSFLASYSYNHFIRTNVNTITDGILKGTEEEDLDVSIHGLTGTFNYKISDNKSLKYKAFFSDFSETQDFVADVKRRSQGGINTTDDQANDDKIRRLHTQMIQYNVKGDGWTWNSTLNYGQHMDSKDRWRNQLKTSGRIISFEDELQNNSELIFNSDVIYNIENHRLKAGLRASNFWRSYERQVYEKIDGRMYWDDVTDGSYTLDEQRVGAYLSDEINYNKIQIIPSVRFDYDQREYNVIATNLTGNHHYFSVNPSIHTKYSIEKDFFAKADIAYQMARPPFNMQVPVDKIKHKKETIERGNATLEPSTALNFSGGIEKYFKNNSYFTFRGFYNIMRDVIESEFVGNDEATGYRIIQGVNVDSATVFGIDFDGHYKIINTSKNTLTLNGNISLLGSQVRDATTGKLRRMNEQPRWIYNASMDYFNSDLKLQFSFGVNYVDERYIAGGTDEGTIVNALVYEPYLQCDARIKYYFKPWANIYLNATNLFDAHNGIIQGDVTEEEVVGRDIRLGVSLTL